MLSFATRLLAYINNMEKKNSTEVGRNDDMHLQYDVYSMIRKIAISAITRYLKIPENVPHTSGSVVEYLHNLHEV